MAYTQYTPANTLHSTISVPDDSEVQSSGVAAFNTGIEELADNARYLYLRQIQALTPYALVQESLTVFGDEGYGGYYNTSTVDGWVDVTNGTVAEATLVDLGEDDVVEFECSFHVYQENTGQALFRATVTTPVETVYVPGTYTKAHTTVATHHYSHMHIIGRYEIPAGSDGDATLTLQCSNIGGTVLIQVLTPIAIRLRALRRLL